MRPFASLVAIGFAWLWSAGCTTGGTREADPAEAPPLRLTRADAGSPTVNDRCLVCHINFSEELIAVTHAEQGVGCETCHGLSDPHAGDEGHLAAPDIIYPRELVKPFCMGCHDAEALAEEDAHEEILAAPAGARTACTDCHGEHRLGRRGVRWDKRTREILSLGAPRDGLRSIENGGAA
ncbi:MAG: cytochrome c3 family protein [Planctomycetes bacterium]|nr:cytochrome c3 family protein [Planctomycetota bacterium]